MFSKTISEDSRLVYNSEAMIPPKVSSSRRRGVKKVSAELTLEDKQRAGVLNLYRSMVGRYP